MQKSLCKYGFILIAASVLASCSKVPDGVLSEKKMRDVMVDVYLAEALIGANPAVYPDSARKAALFSSVFTKHKTSEAVYDSSLVWYGMNMDTYIRVLDMALADVNTRIRDMGDVQASAGTNTNRDSINIWTRRDYMVLSPDAIFNGVTFDIKPERTYPQGSAFVLGMRVWGLTNKMKYTPEIRMVIDQRDTVLFVNKKISKDGYYETTLRGIATKPVTRVYGYIRMDNTDAAYFKVYVDSLKLMKYNYGSPALGTPADSIQ